MQALLNIWKDAASATVQIVPQRKSKQKTSFNGMTSLVGQKNNAPETTGSNQN
jgi:hypothetical protein